MMQKLEISENITVPSIKKTSWRIPRNILYPSVTLLIILLVWEIFGRLKLIDPFMFSWPSKILVEANAFFISGEVFKHLAVSGMEVAFRDSEGKVPF